jgi:hypothetical protein
MGSPRTGGGRPIRVAAARPTPAPLPIASPPAERLASEAAPVALAVPAQGLSVAASPVAVEPVEVRRDGPTGLAPEAVPTETAPASAASASVAPASAASASVAPASAASASVAPASVAPVAPVIRSRRRSGARPARGRSTPIVVAGAILVVALIVAFAFSSIHGGLALPTTSPGPSVPAASVSPTLSTISPSPEVSPTPSSSPPPTATPTVSPSVSPSAPASPTATPAPSPPAAFVGLKPCTDLPDCYLYHVRSGDYLSSIAARFGITLKALKAANPEITDPSLVHVGDVLRIPLPPS